MSAVEYADEVMPYDEGVDLTPLEAAELASKVLTFALDFTGRKLFPYQEEFAWRVIYSILVNDGDEITGLWSRQSGKTETMGLVIAGCMVLLPKLAQLDRYRENLIKFSGGFWVGCFAPVGEQAENLQARVRGFLTSERAKAFLTDPEIDDKVVGKGRLIKLRSGSLCRQQTANPRANIEGTSYHLIAVDESQSADAFTINKSIRPMRTFYNGTIVFTGTPSRVKGVFYETIRRNNRHDTGAHRRTQRHYQYDWRHCAKHNPNYRKAVEKDRERLGEDSEEFQLAYELRWLLDRGMFITEQKFEQLCDPSMEAVDTYGRTPVVVGIDPARTMDSTVVTVVWVNWDAPDEFGYYHHRVLDWLELIGDEWEEQYYKIVSFLQKYDVWAVGVDAGGVGDAVAGRLSRLMPHTQIVPLTSSHKEQSVRWTHLRQLQDRFMIGWPGGPNVRRTRRFKRFKQQMTDLELDFRGPYMLAAAPEGADAHDDYCDSLALACVLTADLVMPEVQATDNPFYGSR